MVGADETTELWRPPISPLTVIGHFSNEHLTKKEHTILFYFIYSFDDRGEVLEMARCTETCPFKMDLEDTKLSSEQTPTFVSDDGQVPLDLESTHSVDHEIVNATTSVDFTNIEIDQEPAGFYTNENTNIEVETVDGATESNVFIEAEVIDAPDVEIIDPEGVDDFQDPAELDSIEIANPELETVDNLEGQDIVAPLEVTDPASADPESNSIIDPENASFDPIPINDSEYERPAIDSDFSADGPAAVVEKSVTCIYTCRIRGSCTVRVQVSTI